MLKKINFNATQNYPNVRTELQYGFFVSNDIFKNLFFIFFLFKIFGLFSCLCILLFLLSFFNYLVRSNNCRYTTVEPHSKIKNIHTMSTNISILGKKSMVLFTRCLWLN